jgi:predicted small lipoprotein YifL
MQAIVSSLWLSCIFSLTACGPVGPMTGRTLDDEPAAVQNSVRDTYIRKYELDPADEDSGGAILFRLERR